MFDFDGVLIDSFDVTYGLTRFKHPDMSADEYRDLFVGNIYDTIKNLPTKITDKPMTNAEYFDLYAEAMQTRQLIPEMVSVVRGLEDTHQLSIVTSSVTEIIKKIIERSSLAPDTFEILGMDVERNKTKKINRLIEKYDADPSDCLFITDTVGDIHEARAAGVESIAVTWGFHDEARLAAASPHALARVPQDIPKIVNNFFDV